MAAGVGHLASSLLGHPSPSPSRRRRRQLASLAIAVALLLVDGAVAMSSAGGGGARLGGSHGPDMVRSKVAAVAADDARCSAAGAKMLRLGGHAVDAAVAAALCLGVVHPVSSGIGGGAFIVVRNASDGKTVAFDARETAPAAATRDMYDGNPVSKRRGALAMAIPGELAGLHAAWCRYGRLPWKDLFQPAIKLARDGYIITPLLRNYLWPVEKYILADPGLRQVFAPGGRLLQANDTCRNPELARTLEAVANKGIQAFYNGSVGEAFVGDVRRAGGIATMDDMRGYTVEGRKPMHVHAMGHTIIGMPPPSSGTVGMSMVLNVLEGYRSLEYLERFIGIHRLVEALKHMYAERMCLGDPNFVNVRDCVAEMLSPYFADEIRRRIDDDSTFSPRYYFPRWSELRDHGTSHLSVIDADRNAVSMTTTVNGHFGAKVLSQSTGIVLNNQMDDFSVPGETADHLPPARPNFIAPGKRPLSSMTPIIVLKDGQLAGVLGASGGMSIIPAVTQVFMSHFVVGMDPLDAVKHPRVYHKLIPNVVRYDSMRTIGGEAIELGPKAKEFLEERGHCLRGVALEAVCQLIVQDLPEPVPGKHIARSMEVLSGGGGGGGVYHGMLTAVSDPRKDGSPAGL